MAELWPRVTSEAELDGLAGEGESLHRGIAVIAARHGLEPTPEEHFADGSLPVFGLAGDLVLKLYPEMYRDDFVIETRVLERIAGRVACPEIVATGEVEGWSYLVMTRLVGRSLKSVFAGLSRSDQLRLAEEMGAWLAALHAIDIAGLELPLPPWREFLESRYAIAVETQRQLGLGEPWLSQIEPYLASVAIDRTAPCALLHTEVMQEHVFVAEQGDGWRLSGVLDFEPSMVGAKEYDFASVGVFTSCGDREMLRLLLGAYGYRQGDLDGELARRFLAYALLHRYTHLGWYLKRIPPAEGVTTLDALAAQWWGC